MDISAKLTNIYKRLYKFDTCDLYLLFLITLDFKYKKIRRLIECRKIHKKLIKKITKKLHYKIESSIF